MKHSSRVIILGYCCIFLLIMGSSLNKLSSASKFNLAEMNGDQTFQQQRNKIFSFITTLDNQTKISYLVYVPESYKPENKIPLLIYLHGGGQTGNNIKKVETHGPPKLIAEGKSFPFIVVSPQLPYKFASKWEPKLVDEVYEHVKQDFNIDTTRFYLTGMSVGGGGTWSYALAYPNKVAAIAPICGWGNPNEACKIKDLPIWTFHGAKDNTVNIASTKNMVNAIKDCGGNPLFTIYPNANHDAWTKTYNNPKLYEWFLSHSLLKGKENRTIENKKKSIPKKKAFSINAKLITSLPVALKESSGLVINQNTDMGIWSINDSGNEPVIFKIDTLGKILSFKRIRNAANVDWEDLSKDEKGNFYIGDFGNNKNNRRELQIYKIPNPELVSDKSITAEVIKFYFPNQRTYPAASDRKNFDIEAMINYKHFIFLFTKNNTSPYSGYCKLYRLPNKPGLYPAELMDSIFLGNTNLFDYSITSADISPDQNHLVLLTYNKLFIFSCFPNSDFFSGIKQELNFEFTTQKESIAFFNNSELYMTDEKSLNIVGGNLYKINLKGFLKNSICRE